MFISFEGIDGSGKSTQADLLAGALRAEGRAVTLTREPGGSPGAEDIRRLLVEGRGDRWSAETELLLFTAARRDHLERTIRPALASGGVVVTDRFADSTRVYQGIARADLGPLVDALHALMIGIEPDRTFVIDMDPAEALARTQSRTSASPAPTNADGRHGAARDSATGGDAHRDGHRDVDRDADVPGGADSCRPAPCRADARVDRVEDAGTTSDNGTRTHAAPAAPGPAAAGPDSRRQAGHPAPAEDRFESFGLPFQQRLREGFLALARQHPDRIRVIDGSGDPAAVAARVRAAL